MIKVGVLVLLLCACRSPESPRLPRIIAVTPVGTGVSPVDLVVTVTFSESVDPAGVEDGRRVALCRAADQEEVTTRAESAEGIAADGPVVAVQTVLTDGGKRAELRPTKVLEPLTGYTLVVGNMLTASGRPVLDPEGRRRTFVSPFETGATPDREGPVARWALPPHGPVPRNVRSVQVAFNESVEGALALKAGPAAQPVTVTPQLLGLDLGGALSAGLLPLSLAGVHDAEGNPARDLEFISVGDCEDAVPPVITEEQVTVTLSEVGLRVETETGELARLGVEAMLPPEESACGALPSSPQTISFWGEMLPCPGADPCGSSAPRCPLTVAREGLCPGRRVRLRLAAEDLAANRSPWGPWREVTTLPGVPRPVITEVLADAAAPEVGGEYVELANLGTADADLTGHTLAKRSASGALTRCSLEPLAGPISPGGYALVVGGSYDSRYPLSEGVVLYRCGSKALLGGLANDRAPAVQLEAPGGEVLSSLGIAAPSLRCSEHSVERLHPAGPDEASNDACTQSSIGTPGACNSRTPGEECPKRPW